ncbi:AAA family ATPase [Granulicella aggregans]|uniref:AAA family ATPase n=1 Tax=Granulicella aggregans TaxID=474949 RepID=UPI0021E0D59A|nr:AAA family ATPase [Granulicella aggregans]
MHATVDNVFDFGFEGDPAIEDFSVATQDHAPEDEIARTVRELFPEPGPLELRGKKRTGEVGSGVYSNRSEFVRKARALSWDVDVEAVWVGLQTLRPDYPLAAFTWRGVAPKDLDIVSWRFIFLDIDPIKGSGASASDEEKRSALSDARVIKDLLETHRIPCITADSGNGWHLLVPFREPRSPETDSLVKRFVQAVAALGRPHIEASEVDTTVSNPGRVCKLYGSLTRKGEDGNRWRASKLRTVTTKVATTGDLSRLIEASNIVDPVIQRDAIRADGLDLSDSDIEDFLGAYGISHERRQPFQGGSKWILHACPIGSHDKPGSKTMVSLTSHGIGFKCQAAKCAGVTWKDFRHHLEETTGQKHTFVAKTQSHPNAGSASTTTTQQKSSPRLTVVSMSDIRDEAIQWLWNGFIPRGKLTLLAGAPGTAKSTMTINFAATISNGGLWPDGTRCKEAGDVMLWSSEDGLADTIKPRLVAAGANTDRVFTPTKTTENGRERMFDPATDIDLVRQHLDEKPGCKMLIIDPIVSTVSGDMHRANDVRSALQPVVDLASAYNVAVIGITHFAKNSGGRNTVDRVLGSQAFGAFARVVLVTAKDEENGDCVLARSKSNISQDTGGHRYRLSVVTYAKDGKVIETTKVEWGEQIEGSARNILLSIEDQDQPPATKIDMAQDFLRHLFSKIPKIESKAVLQKAKDIGIGESSVRKAAKNLGVQMKKSGLGGWMWHSPENLMLEDDDPISGDSRT